MILVTFFIWHYTLGLSYALVCSVDFVKGVFNYFSVFYLLRTLFSPWHSIAERYGRGFALGEYLMVLLGNLVSRVLGVIVRACFIVFGVLATACAAMGAAGFLLFWLLMPFAVAGFFIAGLILLIPA